MMRGNGRPPHILAVNDSQEIFDVFREILEDEGYLVTTSLALLDRDAIKTLAPSLIIQDLRLMPSPESGLMLLTLARFDPELARIPFILCTAATHVVTDEEMVAPLRELGVRDLLKPFVIDDLLTVVTEELTAAPTTAKAPLTPPPQA
jgi:CheY-like chemotaxis protein